MYPLPNLIIAGVVKAGTTSAFTYLSHHRDVCACAVKEALYFLGYRYGTSVPPIEDYRNLFSRWKGEKYIMEATPGYFEGGRYLAENIKQTLPDDVKILIILREPVDRFLSFFKYKRSVLELEKQTSLEEYLHRCQSMPEEQRKQRGNDLYWGLDGGIYPEHLQGWFDVFGESVKVMYFDDIKNNRRKFMGDLCAWLDLDDSIYEDIPLEVENKSQNFRSKSLQSLALSINLNLETLFRRWPGIKRPIRAIYYWLNSDKFNEEYSEDTIKYLHEFYRPHNRQLAETLRSRGYDELPEWLNEASS